MSRPGSRSECRERPDAEGPRPRRGNVLPIEGWNQPLLCPACDSSELLQIDVIECAYPVRGVRRPWGFVLVDVAASSLDPAATHAEFFRCESCDHEWPVEPGTRFVEAEDEEG